MGHIISYKIENPTNLKLYIFDFVLNIIGVEGKNVRFDSSCDQLDLYYGNNPPLENFKLAIPENSSDIIWNQLLDGTISVKDVGNIIEFDIVNAISALMTDEVNRNLTEEAYDKHKRLIFFQSFQAKINQADIPIVNVYINFLKRLFEKNFSVKGIPLWPDGKKCAIGLSHDVDNPDKYVILKAPFFLKHKTLPFNLFVNLRKIKAKAKYLIDRDRENFWLFEDIIKEEEKHNFKSTFFFAVKNKFKKEGCVYDVDYDIEDHKFKEVFNKISEHGFEIGLHASYGAYIDLSRFILEKKRLEEIANVKISGLRHHLWHLGKDKVRTLKKHAEAGFEYDTSMAFNEEMGFRRNIALPFFPWNTVSGSLVNVLQLPVFCMDASLFSRPIEVSEAVKKLKRFTGTIKQTGGLGVIDWHVRTSCAKNSEFSNWGKTYIEFLQYLSDDSEIWTTNLREINSWVRKRRRSKFRGEQ